MAKESKPKAPKITEEQIKEAVKLAQAGHTMDAILRSVSATREQILRSFNLLRKAGVNIPKFPKGIDYKQLAADLINNQ